MLSGFAASADHIILACGATDFRKQIEGLSSLVSMKYKLDPFASGYVFIFCNRRRNSIKVLRYDANGFVLATKKLLDGMKFQWPKDEKEVDEISEATGMAVGRVGNRAEKSTSSGRYVSGK